MARAASREKNRRGWTARARAPVPTLDELARERRRRRPAGPVCTPIVERVTVTVVALDPYLSIEAAVAYSSLSRRALSYYLNLPPAEALPCYRVNGRVLLRRSELDSWLERFRSRGRPEVVRALREMGLDKIS